MQSGGKRNILLAGSLPFPSKRTNWWDLWPAEIASAPIARKSYILFLRASGEKGGGTELVQAIVQEYLPSLYRKGVLIRSGDTFELHPLLGIEATARIDNPASIKILENLQFEFEGIVERHGTDRALYFFSFENVEQ